MQTVASASLSWPTLDTKRGTKVVSLRAEVSWSKCEWDFNIFVGNHTFQPWGQSAERRLLTVPEERASSLSDPLLLPSLSRVALPFQHPHSLDGVGEEGFCWKERLWVLARQPAPGKVVQNRPVQGSWWLILGSVGPSICSLWWWRGRRPWGCSIAFPYFFNIEKIIFKNCDFFLNHLAGGKGKGEHQKL